MTSRPPRTGTWRRLGGLLAALALAMTLIAPAGFMTAATRAGPAIVICTGHGALALPDGGDHSGHRTRDHGQTCSFAGHVSATTPPAAVLVTVAYARRQNRPATLPADLAPGRGLAAPPPPSQGPPALS